MASFFRRLAKAAPIAFAQAYRSQSKSTGTDFRFPIGAIAALSGGTAYYYYSSSSIVVADNGKLGSFLSSPAAVATMGGKSPRLVTEFHSQQEWEKYFEASKNSNKLVVISFSTTWCGPCRVMEPVFRECASKFTNFEFVKLDVDEVYDVAMKFEIQALPTYVFVRNGKVVEKLVCKDKTDLERTLAKF